MYKRNPLYLRLIVLIITSMVSSPAPLISAQLQYGQENPRLKIFYSETDFYGWDAVLKGKVISIGAREDAHKNDLMRFAQDKTKAVVRLYNRKGMKAGDTLFIINNRNLIVARITIASIFKSKYLGYLLIGYGNLRLANLENRVVQRASEESSQYAYIYKSRGDYHHELGNTGESISYYKRAIEMDSTNPEAHLYLGLVYLKKNLLQFALKEFDESYKEIARLYDNEDRYLLLKGMVQTRYVGLRQYRLPLELRLKFKNEGIRYAKEALELYPDSKDVNFYLGMFYYLKPEPSDVDAKNQFLRVIEIDPEKVDAYVSLAVLYKKHKNDQKAEYYAREAIKIDPTNRRARHILKLLD
jgi:tetratricopeptide (TPR) repeat protein